MEVPFHGTPPRSRHWFPQISQARYALSHACAITIFQCNGEAEWSRKRSGHTDLSIMPHSDTKQNEAEVQNLPTFSLVSSGVSSFHINGPALKIATTLDQSVGDQENTIPAEP